MTKSLFESFRDSLMRKPTGSRKEAQDHFVEAMKSDPAYLEMLATDYFERMAAVWTVRHEQNGYSFGRTGASQDKVGRMSGPRTVPAQSEVLTTPELMEREPEVATVTPEEEIERRREVRRESEARTALAYASLKTAIRDVLLLDLELPNGKLLRHATGAECAKAGGFYSEIARHIKPTQVVDKHLTEDKLRDIRARFFQRNAVKAA